MLMRQDLVLCKEFLHHIICQRQSGVERWDLYGRMDCKVPPTIADGLVVGVCQCSSFFESLFLIIIGLNFMYFDKKLWVYSFENKYLGIFKYNSPARFLVSSERSSKPVARKVNINNPNNAGRIRIWYNPPSYILYMLRNSRMMNIKSNNIQATQQENEYFIKA